MKLVETKIYSQLIMITDYVLLGILWVVASLPIITIVPASVATLYVLKQWRNSASGQLLYHFYQGVKKHFCINLLISVLTISIYFTTNLLLQENSQILMISGYVVSIIYLMFLVSWINNCRKNERMSVFTLFEKSSLDLVLSFGRMLFSSMLIFGFTILIFLFPPFIFIFAGAIWKLLDLILSRKSRDSE
jgi:hypothetical protein